MYYKRSTFPLSFFTTPPNISKMTLLPNVRAHGNKCHVAGSGTGSENKLKYKSKLFFKINI